MASEHWRDRFFFAGIVSSSLAGIVLGVLLGFALPHDAWSKARRSVRVALHRERPRWELLTQ
ncbi:MAG: hypothetical protein KGJ86_16100 [Chloroflexota bacterium]|nr:hypothetical protein [Chloroflexota bacterium]